VLDRTAEIAPAVAEPRSGDKWRVARRWLRRFFAPSVAAWRFLVAQSSSSLTRRIVVLNVTGLLALVAEHPLPVAVPREPDRRTRAEPAGPGRDHRGRDRGLGHGRDRHDHHRSGQAARAADRRELRPDRRVAFGARIPINPERVAPLLRRLVLPTRTQARIYDREGALLLDTRNLYGRGDVLRFDLIPVDDRPSRLERAWIAIKNWFGRVNLPVYKDLGPANGRGYSEVVQAINGLKSSSVRVNERGEIIVLVSVPIQRFRAVRGALLLSTEGGEIDSAVAAERLQVLTLFLVLGAVMVLLSMLLARTIAGPVRRLAEGAETVRRRIRTRGEIPDFTYRRDEIGELSGAFREMTNSLYSRIEAIESFAADVAHELKNPLTSLRSAVETMPLAKTPESRARLLAVIEHDVKRLDRLISDVSDASRLDAELQRQDVVPVDLTRLLNTVVTVANEVRRDDGVKITLAFEGGAPDSFVVRGHDSRLGQVVDNLIENARSFSPQGGTVRITARRLRNAVEITVDDDGPGIQPEAMERIFERFYTDRPHQGFRPELRPRPLDLAPDRRGAWRPHPCREPHGRRDRTGRDQKCSARASWCACRRCDDDPRLRGAGRRARRVDPRRRGSGQVEPRLALISAGEAGPLRFARLVGDDRVRSRPAHGRLLVRPHATLAGLLEVRGLGIRRLPFEPVAAVGLVVDLGADSERLPLPESTVTEVAGIVLPRLAVAPGTDPFGLIYAALRTADFGH
jgi:two-component system sensor histidine kinase ChvG